ncbi:MAG: hypothetical protein FWB99_04110 [Treponema sp.]|nr:hypothetical protein [Treponema sp.]
MNKKIWTIAMIFAIVIGAVGTLYAQTGVRVSQLQMGRYEPLGAHGGISMQLNRGSDAWSGTVVYTHSNGQRFNGSWRADGSGADFIISINNIGTWRARTTGTRSFIVNGVEEWVRR